MKYIFSLIVVTVMLSTSVSVAQVAKKSSKLKFSSATEYNDYIVNLQGKTIKTILKLGEDINAGDAETIKKSFNDFGIQAKASLAELKTLGSFKNNSQLRDKGLKLFQFYVDIYEKDYKEMIDIITKKKITPKDQKRIDEIVAKVSKEEMGFDQEFASAQRAFAMSNNMIITENDFQKEIDKK
ncbi:MAG: hypothetical protein WCP69_00905 [Bacteroidota bacterium]